MANKHFYHIVVTSVPDVYTLDEITRTIENDLGEFEQLDVTGVFGAPSKAELLKLATALYKRNLVLKE